jgi:hypothetical protein
LGACSAFSHSLEKEWNALQGFMKRNDVIRYVFQSISPLRRPLLLSREIGK